MEHDSDTELIPGLRHSAGETHLIREITLTHQSLLNIVSRKAGMPPSRLALMRLLALRSPEALGVMEIARKMSVNAAMISRQVKDLEALGLVSRHEDPHDHRRISLTLTPKGQEAFEEVHERAHRLETALIAGATAEEIEITARVLHLVRAAANAMH